MITLTPENIELLTHILDGGDVIDDVGEHHAIVFGTRADEVSTFYRMDTDELLSMSIYLTDDQRQIRELQAKNERLEEQLTQLRGRDILIGPAQDRETPVRPQRSHLKSDEVLQIEMDMKSGAANRDIAIVYGISEATASHVRNGKHKFSTLGFNMAQKIIPPRDTGDSDD